jgi:hypothetical protein
LCKHGGCTSIFSTNIVCGECGGNYGSKVWASTTKYRRTIWRCNDKYIGDVKCGTPHITETELKQRFLAAFNTLMSNRDELLENCRLASSALSDCTALETQIAECQTELCVIGELYRKAIQENATIALDQDKVRSTGYAERYEECKTRGAELQRKLADRRRNAMRIATFIRNLESCPLVLSEFDEKVWQVAVEKVVVEADGRMVFHFKDGTVAEG